MTVMSRIFCSVIVAAMVVITTPPVGGGDVYDAVFGWTVIAVLAILAVLHVKDWFADRRESRNVSSKSTAIQALPIGEYADGEPAAFLFSEDGDAR